MAKVSAVKLKQDADKLEKAGRLEQAIALYRQIVDENPRDWNTINKIGDLYAKLNRNREASEQYAKVADFYAKDGFHLKAIAIWKKINKLDASALEPYLNLADLYARQGLMMEAKSQYQIVVDEFVKRGKLREAGDVLRRMADVDPADLKVRSKLADLYTRGGSPAKAVEEHVAIAEQLNKKGHLAEALQVLEKGLKVDPQSSRLRLELARIHLLQKNPEKAAHFLEEAVRISPDDAQILARLGEAYLGSRKIERAEAIFRRLLEIDPQDEESRVQMGRLHLVEGEFDQAYEQLAPVADRMLEHKEGESAAALLQQVVQKNPAHVKSLVKLAEIYRALHTEGAVAATYSQLTEAYIKQGDMEQAASVLEMLVGLEPQNQQHVTKLEFVRGRLESGRTLSPPSAPPSASPPPAAVSTPPPAPDFEEEDFELSTDDGQTLLEEAPVAPPEPPPVMFPSLTVPAVLPRFAIETTGPLSDEDREFIEEHLAEGKVFRKYGLVDKAADQFESVVARFPDHVEARQELREVYREKNQLARAAEQCLALAEICRLKGDLKAAAAHSAEAQRLASEAVSAPSAVPPPAPEEGRARGRAREPRAPEHEELVLAPTEEGIGIGEDEEEIPLDLEEGALETNELSAPDSAAEMEEAEAEAEEELAPALDLGEEGSDQELRAAFVEDESLEDEPGLALTEVEEDLASESPAVRTSPAEAFSLGLADELSLETGPEASLELESAPPAAAPSAASPPELQRVLEEVDSYISLGFVDDALEALREIGGRYRAHPAILAKVEELGLDQDALQGILVPPEPEEAEALSRAPLEAQAVLDPLGDLAPTPALPLEDSSSPSGPAHGNVDLGSELEGLFGAQSAVEEPATGESASDLGDSGLADIFKEFRKGVDQQLGKEDYDTRYNLGIAYKEMGLVDEAIAEFQLAAKDESRLLECSSMLGICFLEKGMPKLAVRWFEKGLKAEGRSEEEYQGLRYDLAMAHEAAGEIDQALNLYTDLYGQDANFRDVAAKVRELRAARG